MSWFRRADVPILCCCPRRAGNRTSTYVFVIMRKCGKYIYALNNCRIRTTFRKSYQNGCMPCSNSKVTTPIAHMSTANPWGTRLTSSGAKYDCKVKKRAHRVQGRKGSAPTTFVCPGDYFNPVILMSGYIVSSILGGITFDQLSVYMSRVSRKTAVDVAKKIPGRFRD